MRKGCARGKSDASQSTKSVLLAESGGYCENPDCNRSVFVDTASGRTVHFAEMAHIIGASPDGARGDADVPETERAAADNFLVLCSTCHTIVDKAEEDYPVDVLRGWKATHRAKLDSVFGVREVDSRQELRQLLDPRLRVNHVIFQDYGPDSTEGVNPYDAKAPIWRTKVREDILPNNRLLLRMLEANRRLLSETEKDTVAHFEQHVVDLERRHTTEGYFGGARWPETMDDIALDTEGIK
jgi:hypothetical protein